MPDYNAYIKSAGITGTAFTEALHAKYPSFTKIQKSMVCQPGKYGMQLLPEAEAALVGSFGSHPGLAFRDPRRVARKPHPVRTKPHRLVVYLPDDTHNKLRALMERRGYSTVQDFLCTILTNLVNFEEKKAQKEAAQC